MNEAGENMQRGVKLKPIQVETSKGNQLGG